MFNSSFLGELDVAFTQKIKTGYFVSRFRKCTLVFLRYGLINKKVRDNMSGVEQ